MWRKRKLAHWMKIPYFLPMVDESNEPKSEPPEFGPNGVVLNAPGMTDEMLVKIQAEESRVKNVSTLDKIMLVVAVITGIIASDYFDLSEWMQARGLSFFWFASVLFVLLTLIIMAKLASANSRDPNP